MTAECWPALFSAVFPGPNSLLGTLNTAQLCSKRHPGGAGKGRQQQEQEACRTPQPTTSCSDALQITGAPTITVPKVPR